MSFVVGFTRPQRAPCGPDVSDSECIKLLSRNPGGVAPFWGARQVRLADHPYLFAVSVGDWELSDSQAARLRQYCDRGGFLIVDDFHNDNAWANFMYGVRQIYRSAQIIELDTGHQAFHTVFDMAEHLRVPGADVIHEDGIERGGVTPHWRAVLDPGGRMIIAITLGVNSVIYAMTH